MRRKEKEISTIEEIEKVIKQAEICRLAMSLDDVPYLVPLCFGYQRGVLYFHSADDGKKIEILRKNPNVCFEFEGNNKILAAEKACNWSAVYKSVIGFGQVEFVEDEKEKIEALDRIMSQYSEGNWEYKPKMLQKTLIFKVIVEEITGKQSLD